MITPELPLVDLHRHLDGNIRPVLIKQLATRFGHPLADASLDAIRQSAQITDKTSDLMAFLSRLDVGISVLADAQACFDVAFQNIADAADENLDYVELRFSPRYMASAHSLALDEVIEAVADGVAAGCRQFPVKANLIGILSRTYGVDACSAELEAILRQRKRFCALDLAGDELRFPAQGFVKHFQRAREQGLAITVHAGEADGPTSIWNAIELLGATRIGHGVAAASDDSLMVYMREHQIAVETCLTSNYQTATIDNLVNHPMRKFFDEGLLVTLNTDDPGVSDIDLAHEYELAASVLNFSADELRQIQRNGVTTAFLNDEDKRGLYAHRKKPSDG